MRLQKEKAFPPSFHATKRNLPPFIFFVGNPHLPPRIPLCSMIAHTLINIFFHIVYCLSLSLSLSLSFFHNSHTQMYLPITHSFSIFLYLSFCLSFTHNFQLFSSPFCLYARNIHQYVSLVFSTFLHFARETIDSLDFVKNVESKSNMCLCIYIYICICIYFTYI